MTISARALATEKSQNSIVPYHRRSRSRSGTSDSTMNSELTYRIDTVSNTRLPCSSPGSSLAASGPISARFCRKNTMRHNSHAAYSSPNLRTSASAGQNPSKCLPFFRFIFSCVFL